MSLPLRAAPFFLLLAGAGCATTDPGWTGSGAMPFDAARALCESRAREVRKPDARDAAFRVCMAEHGWTRGEG